MPKTRKLSDLYVTGTMVEFDDGNGSPIKVWLQKLNPVEQEKAMRQANAARAKCLAMRKDTESVEYQNLYSQVYDLGDSTQLLEYLVAPEIARLTLVREAELAQEEEWSKDNYLQGLRDAWEGDPDSGEPSMMRRYHEDDAKEDTEAQRIFAELKRFADEVDGLLVGERENLQRDFESKDIEELREKVLEQLIEVQSDLEWMNEFRKNEIWLATRDPEYHRNRYFENRDEIDDLSIQVKSRLLDEYRALTVDVIEGKDLEATETSSPPVEQPRHLEMVGSSGQQDAPL